MTTASADIIDLLAGLTSGGERGVALAAVRDERPQARESAQRSFEALLEPAAPGTFPLAERYAVAAYVAQLHAFDTATAFYGDLLGDEEPALVAPVAAAAAASACVVGAQANAIAGIAQAPRTNPCSSCRIGRSHACLERIVRPLNVRWCAEQTDFPFRLFPGRYGRLSAKRHRTRHAHASSTFASGAKVGENGSPGKRGGAQPRRGCLICPSPRTTKRSTVSASAPIGP